MSSLQKRAFRVVGAREVEGMSQVEGMARITLEKEAGDAMGLG